MSVDVRGLKITIGGKPIVSDAGLVTGSMASRSTSPKIFSATTTTVTIRPGHTTVNGNTLMSLTEVARECPQLGTPDGTPIPR